jgi:hypothetical protein
LAFLFGRKKNDKPEYTSLQLQTATNILAIPILWGTNRIAPNVIFYNNFYAEQVPHGKGGKGGMLGGGSQGAVDYHCDLVLALCEGPIKTTRRVWKDRLIFGTFDINGEQTILIWDQTDNGTDPLFVFNGYPDQKTWGYFASLYPSYPLAFPWTAYLAAAQFGLGASATIGLFNVEVIGPFAGTGSNGQDADPALVIQDFLTNLQYGASFDSTLLDTTTLLSSGGNGATVQDYCKAMGIQFSPLLTDQEQGSSILTRWLQICNTAAVWSGQKLKFVPYGDTSIAAGQILTATITETVPQNPDNIPGGFGFGFIDVSSAGQYVADLGVKYSTQYYGLSLQYVGATIPPGPGFYGRIGATYYFSQLDIGVAVTLSFQYTIAGGYTPNLTPLYVLNDDDYVDPGGDSDPMTVERVDPYTLPTIQRIEVSSRGNNYASIPVEARDQSQIEIFGPRVGTTISAREICDEIVVGPTVAQAILQRQLYVRATYKFKTDWTFCLLDPMDIIALNDRTLDMQDWPVRIVSIEEDDNGLLDFVCEELVFGIATAPLYNTATSTSIVVNRAQVVGPVNSPPLIYQPPSAYTGGNQQVMLGASSSLPATGLADPNWGGAFIWASVDGASYTEIAQVLGPTPQGFLTASVAGAASGWDAVNTISVDLTESGGTLSSSTQAAAMAAATLCLVDGELFAFANATLVTKNKYNLTGLARGLFSTSGVAHGPGAMFTYLSSTAVLTQAIPSQWVGQTIYLKFQSFNIFGQSGQDLSACAVYIFDPISPPYTPPTGGPPVTPTPPPGSTTSTGDPLPVGAQHPIVVQLSSGNLDLGQVTGALTLMDDFGSVATPATGTLDLGTVLSYDPIAQQLNAALPNGTVDLGAINAAVTMRGDFGGVLPTIDLHIDLRSGTTP